MRSAASILPGLLGALCIFLGACSPAMRASLALSRGDYPEAVARYQEALAKEPDSTFLNNRLGRTYLAMKDYPRAEARFTAALAKTPGDPETVFYLGLARIGKGEREDALAGFDAFVWPFKFHQQKAVREEAQRLRRHPELPPEELMRDLRKALDRGVEEQQRYETEMRNMYN
jgi:tetratricopeptide (TPR) repeat protein